MKIKDAAKKYGVSAQAIYKRLQTEGIEIETLKDPETGELSADGEAALHQLYGGTTQKRLDNNQLLERLKEENKALRTEVETLQRLVEWLKNSNEDLKQDKAQLQRALEQAQNLHQETINRLLPGKVEQKQPQEGRESSTAPVEDKERKQAARDQEQPQEGQESSAAPVEGKERKQAARDQERPQRRLTWFERITGRASS